MATKNFVIIRTQKGRKYAGKILRSIKWINENTYPASEFKTYDYTIAEFLAHGFEQIRANMKSKDTIIHARCANPNTEWTRKLRELQNEGYIVINSVDCIELTSNKLACSLHLQGKVNHPKSWEYKKGTRIEDFYGLAEEINEKLNSPVFIIAKPLTSLEQGANVKKIAFFENEVGDIQEEIEEVPGNKIVIQEYIPYIALHRVIVIGGKALPYTFIDKLEFHKVGDWKVSCCLNKTTMKLNEKAEPELLELAEKTQKEVGGVINFIDIFEYFENGKITYTNAEINTACSLNIHEKLAKEAGRKDWNIHYRIARQLVKELKV